MKTNKLSYILSATLILGSLALFSSVLADNNNGSNNNDRSGEDHGRSEQAKEAHQRGSTLEVHISDNGKVLVRGAKVTAVSGSIISASTSWGVASLAWTVNVMTDSQLIKRSGGRSLMSEIVVGDFISFQGTLVTTSATPIIVNATTVKDWSIQKTNTTLSGTVKTVDAVGLKFVLASSKNGDVTVNTSSATTFKKGDVASVFADAVVGAKVSVKGLFDSQSKVMTASEVKVSVPALNNSGNN